MVPVAMQSTPVVASAPEKDYAVALDGNDYLSTTDTSWLGASSPSKLTVSLWARYDDASPTGNDTLFQLGYNTSYRTKLSLSAGALQFYAHGDTTAVNLPFSPTAGAWHHYAMVYDEAATNVYSIYVDGVSIGTHPAQDMTFADSSLNRKFYFGGWDVFSDGNVTGGRDYFEGRMDEIRVYREAKTQSEIQALMHSYSAEDFSTDGLRAYWPMNAQNANNVGEFSTNTNFHLALKGNPTFSQVVQETVDGSDSVLTFPRSYLTSDGGWTVPTGVSQVRSLVVAGGGGGGADEGGGGGAGGFTETSSQAVSGTEVVKVGQGGNGGYSTGATAIAWLSGNGQSSTFGGITTIGGGGGGDATASSSFLNEEDGREGGSGGGGAGENHNSQGGNGTVGQGNAGDGGTSLTGFGGGGAGSAGSGRNGGSGKSSNISGSKIDYAAGGSGGGGNGGSTSAGTSASSIGGQGGGDGGPDATAGAVNSGSGGGGGPYLGAPTYGAPGGSGVVIIRFATPLVPGTVQGFSADTRLVDGDSDTDSVTLNWDELTGQTPAVTGYLIEYNQDNDFSTANSSTFVSGGGTTTTTITGLDDGDTYYFRIKARNVIGDSASGPTAISRAISKTDSAFDTTGGTFASSSAASIPASGDFTTELWVRMPEISGSRILLSQGDDDKTFYLKTSDGVVISHINNSEENSGVYLTQGAWHHIALTVDASDASTGAKLYLDGTQIDEFSGTRLAFSTSGVKGLHIGALSRDGQEGPDSELDQIKIWGDALTSEEIVQSMHTWGDDTDYDGTADIDNLIAHYDFNDNTQAATLRDMKGQNDLTINGASTTDFKQDSILNEPTRAGYRVYEFKRSYLTANGGWTVPSGISSVDYLVVGGGGAGGGGIGGGGGAGEFIETTSASVSGTLEVVVGMGGRSQDNDAASSGQPSKLNDVIAFGGGAGGSGFGLPTANYFSPATGNIGSGGGGHFASNGAVASSGGSGSSSDGGAGSFGGGTTATAGGGGGAGAVGSNGTTTDGGAGGAGKTSTILQKTLAGGGGGGVNGGSGALTSGNGGSGQAGGGNGGLKNQTSPATNNGFDAMGNTGSGGGGASNFNSASANGLGGAGGSGVVALAAVNSYTLTLDNEGSSTTQSLDYESTPADPNLSKTGFRLVGWSDEDDLSAEYEADLNDYSMPASNDILYAIWQSSISITTPTTGLSGTFDEAFSLSIATSEGTGGNTYSATGLGSGLSINSSTGVISGTPTATGNQTVAVTVTDSGGSSATTANFTISIAQKTLANSSAPTVAAVPGERKQISASWDSVANAASYTIKIYDSNDSLLKTITGVSGTSATITSSEFASIADNTQYKISVTAVGTGNYVSGAESASAAVTTNRVFSVTWDVNGGSSIASTTYVDDGTVSKPSDPIRSNFVFGGWSTSEASNQGNIGNRISSWPYDPDTDTTKTYYAIWLQPCSPSSSSFIGSGTSNIASSTYGANGNAYTQEVITATDSCGWVVPTGVTEFDVLVVAGGGSGGYFQRAGGGGAGEVIYSPAPLTANSGDQFLIDVGSGGGFSGSDDQGKNGEDSHFGYFTALGGGAGGGGDPFRVAQDGGSGGGAARCLDNTHGDSLSTDRYTQFNELGNDGGGAIGSCSAVSPGGGGGGAGSPGNNSGPGLSNNGAGGDAVQIFGRVVAGGGAAWKSGAGLGGAFGSTTVGGSWTGGIGKNGVDGTGSGGTSQGTGGDGIVVIRYQSPSVTLTLDNEGSTSTQTVTVGQAPNDPSGSTSRAGFILAGWSDDDDNDAEYAADLSDYVMPGSPDTVYAVWSADDLSVSFDVDGGDSKSSVTVKTDATMSDPGDPTKTGYTFDGWSLTDGGSAVTFPLTHGKTADFTLFALWSAADNTVTFKSNFTGGPADKTQTITTDQATALNQSFTRTGYDPAGWSTAADGSGTGYTLTETVTIQGDLELFAQWTPGTYTVTYDFNGATGGNTRTDDDFTTDSVAITLPVPTRTGYTFDGWFEESDFSGTKLGVTFTTAADITIYAKWTANTYTVLYEYNGSDGGDSDSSDSYTTGGTSITLPVPTRTGYTFAGWHENADLSDASDVSSPYTTSVNRTLYAGWSAIDYALSYNANNGSGSLPASPVNYNYQDSVGILGPGGLTRTGYSFVGWTQAADGSGTVYTSGDTLSMPAQAVTLYAKWSANTYTITYHKNGAAGALAKATDSYTTNGSNVTLPGVGTMSKTGYDFDGWSPTPTGSKLPDSYSTTEDVTLYARWVLKDITYSYARGVASGTNVLDAMLGGASLPTGATAKYGTSATLSNALSGVEIDALLGDSQVDHEFFGWSDGSAILQPGESYVLGETNPTFTAQWAKLFRVNYAFGGGTAATGEGQFDSECTNGDDTCSDGQGITLNAAPSRAGYDFTGWEDQSGNSYSAGGSMTVDANRFLLYAQWSEIDYFFSFNSNGGSETTTNKTQNIGDLIGMPSPGTRDGYTFDGWDDGSNKYPAGSTFLVGTAGASFTASWIPDVYTVSYDWQGGTGTPEANDSFTVGTGPMTLPSQGDRVKDGFEFAGWSETPGGAVLSDYEPDSDQVLYAVWSSGNYTINFDSKGGSGAVSNALIPRTESRTLPTPSRAGFVFNGWFDSATGGNKIGNAGASFTPAASKTLHARWVQRSLFGVDEASLKPGASSTLTASATNQVTGSISDGGIGASIVVPAGSLDAGTVVTAKYFKDTVRQSSLISGDNNYFFSVLVSWLKGSGDSATVPDTALDRPVEVTLTNGSIKQGARIYQIIGDQVTDLGVATQDGTVTVELFEDPEIVIAATKPDAPTGAGAVAGDAEATVSWTAPANNGGAEITQYTVTSTPGSLTCVTATTTCDVTGLTNGVSYSFSVAATNSVGTSTAVQTSSVTPALTSYNVTFNSNGGSSVGSGSFISGGSISEPTDPTRSNFTFGGWSTTKDDASTKVSFPYSPGVDQNITLFALWTAVSSGGSSGGSGGGSSEPAAPVTPENSEIGFIPELPKTPVSETGPVAEIIGETVEIDTDSSNENLVAAGAGWQVKVQSKTESGSVKPVSSELKVSFEYSSAARFSGSGLQANTVLEAWVFSEPTYLGQVSVDASGNLDSVINLPESLLPGEHTLQLGTVTATGKLVKLSIPIIVEGKVTVGTFKGYIAIYTKFLDGERLSARVAGRWLVQDPIDTFKDFGYSRVVRFTGAGYDILVDLYINREFYKRVTTRTR